MQDPVDQLLDICRDRSFGIFTAQRNVFGPEQLKNFQSLLADPGRRGMDHEDVVYELFHENGMLERENALANWGRDDKLAQIIKYERLDRFTILGIFKEVMDRYYLVWYPSGRNESTSHLLLEFLKKQSDHFGQDLFLYQLQGEPVCLYFRPLSSKSGLFDEWQVESLGYISSLEDLEGFLGRSKLLSYINRAGIDVEARIDSKPDLGKSSPSIVDLMSQESIGYAIRRVYGPIDGWDGSFGFFAALASEARDAQAERHMNVVAFLEEIAKERYIPTTEFEAIADRLEAKRKRLSRGVRRRIARKFPLFSES